MLSNKRRKGNVLNEKIVISCSIILKGIDLWEKKRIRKMMR